MSKMCCPTLWQILKLFVLKAAKRLHSAAFIRNVVGESESLYFEKWSAVHGIYIKWCKTNNIYVGRSEICRVNKNMTAIQDFNSLLSLKTKNNCVGTKWCCYLVVHGNIVQRITTITSFAPMRIFRARKTFRCWGIHASHTVEEVLEEYQDREKVKNL